MIFASVAPFVVAQYNVLAGYLGDNRQPWFLHGLDVSGERRSHVMKKFYERDERGKLVNFGWPSYVEGILSDEERRLVESVHDQFFSWEVRRPRLLRTIRDMDADLISLVECDHYEEFWSAHMEKLGYGALYKQRPGRSKDGCAIFYRREVFELEAFRGIEFLGSCSINGDDNSVPSYGDRVALLALLRHRDSGRRLIFVSTHLARNPEDPNKTKDRARQVAQLLYELTVFATQHDAIDDGSSDSAVPAMIAGDMNETNLRHIATIARIKCGLADETCHPLVFASRAPKTADTSITACRQMRIDYLLLQPNLLEVLEAFDFDCVSPENPIPNERHPSDHLPIAFRIAFRDYRTTVRGYAASWVDAISSRSEISSRLQKGTSKLLFSKDPLRLDEIRMAFGYFNGDGDGSCDLEEFRARLAQLNEFRGEQGSAEADTILELLKNTLPSPSLTLAEFTAIYIKSWLRQQDSFYCRVRSMQTIFDLDLSSIVTSGEAAGHAVDVDELFDYVIRNNFGIDSYRSRVRDAFSFFDFDASSSFDLAELYKSFSSACPFDVKSEPIQDVFDGMKKNYDEKITLDEFAEYLARNQFLDDPRWVWLKDTPSSL